MRANDAEGTIVHPQRVLRWNQVKRNIAEWRLRLRSRYELRNLSDRSLRDIGLSRSAADVEASKPFWMI